MQCVVTPARILATAMAAASLAICPTAFATPNRPSPHSGSAAQTFSTIDPDLKAAIASAPSAETWPNCNDARLLDIGDVTVKPDGTVVARYRLTYKLFNSRQSARELAEVNLPYNSSYQTVHVLSARTIKKDGRVVPVAPADIRTAAQFQGDQLYDDAQGYGFSMPGIEDNCVIDYTWEEISKPLVMPGQFTTNWTFNSYEPVSISKLTLHVPVDKTINFKVHNDPNLKPTITLSSDGKMRTYVWEKKLLKPLDVEPFMPQISDVTTWMEVSSLGSWSDIAHWFSVLETPQARPTAAIRATVDGLVKGRTTDEEKARAIYDWVANTTRYVGLEFGLSAFKPHAAGDVYDKLYGDCKDKATLLITMLDLVGIKADPVLLHADVRRKIDGDLPTLNAFDHCIALAQVNGHDVWLDATAEACSFGDIPYQDRGVQALVVHDGQGVFRTIPIFTPEENGMDIISTIDVKPDGSASAALDVKMRGQPGQDMRATARDATPDMRKQIMLRMAQGLSTGATLTSWKLPDGADKSGPFVLSLDLAAPNFATKAGHLLLVPLSLGGGAERANPYAQDTRTWPIVQEESSIKTSVSIIKLPDGYVVDDLPGDVDVVGPLEEYHRKITRSADGKTITVTGKVIEHPGVTAAADFRKVRDYYDTLLKTTGDQLVLKQG